MRSGNAIGSRAEDRLDRAGFADHVAAALRGAAAAQGLVVALVGAWGSGKTFVLNMVKEQLSSAPSRTVLTFNPWMFSGRERLAPAVTAARTAGWESRALARFVGTNTGGIRSPYAVLAARLSAAELPAPPAPARRRPPWCGESGCDPATRFLLDENGYPGTIDGRAVPCPRCGTTAARQRAPTSAPRGPELPA